MKLPFFDGILNLAGPQILLQIMSVTLWRATKFSTWVGSTCHCPRERAWRVAYLIQSDAYSKSKVLGMKDSHWFLGLLFLPWDICPMSQSCGRIIDWDSQPATTRRVFHPMSRGLVNEAYWFILLWLPEKMLLKHGSGNWVRNPLLLSGRNHCPDWELPGRESPVFLPDPLVVFITLISGERKWIMAQHP